jgi:hypothetical protein
MQIINRRIMASMPARLRTAAIISSALVLPFMILELTNRRGLGEGFPIALFGLMWLLPFLFILILTPILHHLRARPGTVASPQNVWLRVAVLLLIAWLWVVVTLDQLPCFLGIPNCD